MKTTNILKAIGISFGLLISISSFATAPGITHQWSGEGDANDSVGVANGTIVNSGATNIDGTPVVDVAFAPGQIGQAFAFDGFGYIDCGTTNVAAFGTSDFAISLWVKTAGDGILAIKQSYGVGYRIRVADGRICCDLYGGDDQGNANGQHLNVTSQSRVNDGNFHNVVVERYGVDLYVFVDGVISGKSTATALVNMPELPFIQVTNQIPIYDDTGTNQVLDLDGNPTFTNDVETVSAPSPFQIGADLNGLLDEIQVYSRALTAYEIYSITHPGVELAFIDQPLNQRGLSGRPIILHSLAVGIDPLTYQWRLNGADIPGATSNNLYFNVPRTFDSGTYSVVIGNPSGTLTSRDATLTITNLATPTIGLLSRWSGEGTANDLTGQHNGITSNIKYVKGVLGTCFQFSGSSSVQCGNVIGNIGTADFTIDFWMQTRATPNDRMPVLGQRPYCSATDCLDFRLFSTGIGLTYIFNELGDHRDLLNPPFNYESTRSSLTSVHLNDGLFHHIAAVRKGNELTLYVDGSFVQSSYSAEPCLIANNGSFNMGIGACGGGYVGCLDEVEVFARALSDKEVYNTYSPDPSLSILHAPISTYVVEGTPTSMTCSAAGTDPITYQWRLNGINIPGATSSTYSLAAAVLADDGIYTVAVGNPVTNKVSSAAMLTVIPANSILPGLVSRWSAEGDYVDSMGNAGVGGGASAFAPGVSGQAWSFVGEENMVGVDYHTGQVGYNDFTWSLWLRYAADGTLISAMPSYRFGIENGLITARMGDGFRSMDEWGIMFDSAAGSVLASSPVPINDNVFHHVVFMRENLTQFSIYIDGMLSVQTTIPPFDFESTWGLGFADDYGRSLRFRGLMDEVELYNRALTPDEVAGLYSKFANGPRADYQMRDINAQLGMSIPLYAGVVSGGLVGPLTYQWTFNGVPIAGATSDHYTVLVNDDSAAGIYAVTITSGTGSVTSPLARVSVMLSPGMYNGLFYFDGDTTDDDDGFITLTLDINSTFSGSIMQKAKRYSFTGKISGTSTTVQVNRKNLSPLNVTFTKANSKAIHGYVASGGRAMPLQAHRAVYDTTHTSPKAGSYTVQMVGLSSPTAPNGHGFGNVTVSPNGAVTLIANLADDTVVSQGAMVANSGKWPVYVPAYAGKGSVIGWLSFTNNGGSVCSGNLKWTKKQALASKNYKAGFATTIPVVGSTFTPPTVGLGIGVTNSSVVLDAAQLYNPLTAPVVSSNLNTIVFAQTGSKGSVRVMPSTGRFQGAFINPVTKKSSPMKGIVLQNQGYAAGYFMSPSLSGRAVLQHN